jgi:hypothetical protein
MSSMTDEQVATSIAVSSWERMKAAAEVHAEALAAMEEAVTRESLALLEVAEMLLEAVAGSGRSDPRG